MVTKGYQKGVYERVTRGTSQRRKLSVSFFLFRGSGTDCMVIV